jgi:hypothetical protein
LCYNAQLLEIDDKLINFRLFSQLAVHDLQPFSWLAPWFKLLVYLEAFMGRQLETER